MADIRVTLNEKPTIVCLLGSTRFKQAHEIAMMHESLMGRIVIPCGLYGHLDSPEGSKHITGDGDESLHTKKLLDELHYRKIDLADEVLVINVGNYVGSSTTREINYAKEHGKAVRFMF